MLLKYRSYFIKKSDLFQKIEYFLSWHIKKFLYIFYIKILCANIIKFSTSDHVNGKPYFQKKKIKMSSAPVVISTLSINSHTGCHKILELAWAGPMPFLC